MRIGENPTKFARRNKGLVQLNTKVPARLLAATVVYIPRLSDYYAESLSILKASLQSLRKTIPDDFDLLVYDNGSCDEVMEYLQAELAAGRIDWLWRSSGNMKKIGAWNHIFGAAQSELVYYFDCDILHRPGWYERCQAVFDAYPHAGIVNAAPIPMKDPEKVDKVLSTTLQMLNDSAEISSESGQFTSDDWYREFGESLGSHADEFLVKSRRFDQVKAVCNGVEAFAQIWHAQFLVKTELLRPYFPRPRDWADGNNDEAFDRFLNELPVLKLGITEPLVAHLGNTVAERYRDEIDGLLGDPGGGQKIRRRQGGWRRQLLRIPGMRALMLRLHAFTFKLIYNVE